VLSRLRYPEHAPEGVARLRAFEHYLNTDTSLSPVLLEIVRLRVSQINGCEFCLQLHAAELRKHNEPDTRIEAVAHWESSDAFTGRERAALAWAEAVTTLKNHASDAEYEAASLFFHQKELVDLTLAIGSINLWNRLGIAFRPGWNPEKHAQKQAEAAGTAAEDSSEGTRPAIVDDGSKVSED
jgi:AhpD family alkylhydroperoxidase